ncbi:MAG: GNAT family N-acetyltransferase [Chitinispirillaceae bacterium]|nr:GNAT family N-acetyltransferase [Chitinispirillaceae bacterium]
MITEQRGKYIFETYTSFEELECCKEFWDKNCNNYNADYDFYKLITTAKREECVSPFVIKVRSEDRNIIGLLIGRKEPQLININIGYYSLFKLKVRGITIIYGGIIGNFTDEDIEATVNYILRLLKRFKVVKLLVNFLNSSSPFVKYFTQYLWRVYFPTKISHWEMRVPQTMDVFYSKFKHKHRYWLKRMANLIETDFKDRLRIEIIENSESIEDVSRKLEHIASKTYHRKLGVGFKDDELNRARLKLCAEKKWLRVYLLTIDSEPVAFWYVTTYRGICYLNFTGYLEKYEKYEIGTYLLLQCIAHLSKEKGVDVIDFGFGDALYKQRFGDRKWEEISLEIFSFSFQGLICWILDNSIKFINLFLRKIIEKFNIFHLVKRWWRKLLKKKAV